MLVARPPARVRYYLDDWGDRLVIRTNADGAEDFKIVTAPASAPGRENWRDLVPYKEGRQVLDVHRSPATWSGSSARMGSSGW